MIGILQSMSCISERIEIKCNREVAKDVTAVSDRIEKEILLHAPRSRVWRALTDPDEFGAWFGVKLQSGFAPGSLSRGSITSPGYEHLTMEMLVERMDPEQVFSFRWHPYAIDQSVDYSSEPMTLVEFRLYETPEGTRLTVVESGFERIPLERRAESFDMNADGWSQQMENIRHHVEG
jgi:uncharacterized protein YndB with AHSA1/START domain